MAEHFSVGFVGAGKVGCALGRYFMRRGLPVCGYSSRREESAAAAARWTGTAALSLAEVAGRGGVIFLTVPDDALAAVWEGLRAFPLEGKAVCHCSGLHSSRIFAGIEAAGACGYSLHPLCAVTGNFEKMDEVCFTLEGAGEHPSIGRLLSLIGNRVRRIEPEQKAKYHAAAVFCSNFAAALTGAATRLFAECGLDEDFSENAWRYLFTENAANVGRLGPVRALTGPIERGDCETVRRHLEALDGRTAELYRLLSRETLALAHKKNPERDYTKMKEVLRA